MSATGDAIAFYMDTAGTITIPVASYSYSFWYKATHVPNNAGATTNPMGLDAAGGATQDIGATWDHPNAALYKAFVHLQNAGGACRVQFSGTPAANVWAHFCITWDGTTLRLYYNGILNNTAAGTNPPNVAPTVTVLAYANGASGFDNATMGELTVWNTTLTAAEAFSLGTGTLATTVQNSAIIFYSTLNTGDPGAIGPALTNHGATINSSYFGPSDGGMKIGGDPVSVTAYKWTMAGGLSFGGGSTIIVSAYHWTTSVGFALGGDQPVGTAYGWISSDGGMAFGGSMATKTTYTVAMAGGLALGGDATRVIHATANGAVAISSGREDAYTTK